MPIFQLNEHTAFPSPVLAEKNGLLAIGGGLSTKRLLSAYSQGIFPWYSEDDPTLWWFTDPRLVLFPDEFHIPKRLARTLRNTDFRTTFDEDFRQVIQSCADIRTKNDEGTWINPDMQEAYIALNRAGYAHSVECWLDDELAGGLYGVQIDNVFFGESMFTKITDASKIALVALVSYAKKQGIKLIDCQMTTSHLLNLGAREINGSEFRLLLETHIKQKNYEKL